MCGALAGPSLGACCHSCTVGVGDCQGNGCYGGWFCNTQSCRCQAPPNAAACASDGGAAPPDAGFYPRPDGSIGGQGGTLDQLRFAIVGDTRPATVDDTPGYPSSIIGEIWQDVEAEQAAFAVSTGDYIFATPGLGQADPQFDRYLAARGAYQGLLYSAMGNMECTGATASNCGASGVDGLTENYQSFLLRMLGPLGQTNPYYSVRMVATDGSWSAKFVFLAPNAWGPDQASWLETALSDPTTYTFVVRHETAGATRAPGVSPSKTIIGRHPYTILLEGHSHTFYFDSDSKELVAGNGGAPLSGAVDYGYVIAERRADGAIQFSAHDYETRVVFEAFAVQADGTVVP
jgi:hypothetical protein